MACTLTIRFMFTTLSCEHFGLLAMLWFDFFAGLKFMSFCFKLITVVPSPRTQVAQAHYESPEQHYPT